MAPAAPMVPGAQAAPAAPAEAPAEEKAPETKYLAERLLEGTRAGQILESNGIKFYGWLQMSYSNGSTRGTTLPGAPFADRSGEFSLNQAYFRMEKTIDTDKKEFQLGFRNDFIAPGTDARFTIMRDLFDNQANRLYPIDNVQSYAEAYLPNLMGGTSVKIGRLFTSVGYETIDAVSTPFLTRSYNFQYNPFTNMAVLFTTPINENISASYGLALGNDNFFGSTNRLTFLGTLKWAPKDGDTTLALNTVITNPKYQTSEAFNHFNTYNAVLTHKLGEKLNYALDFTYSHEDNVPLANGVGSTYWYGFAQYLAYDHSKCLQSNFRVELFEDKDGWRTGTSGLYTSLTYGMTWKRTESIWIRPEARYDYNVNGAFENGKKGMVVGALSAILRF
ncbi:MAG: outer membrane beta-barrel protein [Gemmataceae bacterium]